MAIVGARNASSAGLRIAEALAAELGGAGLVVVSGLARGIDGAAHRGAMHVGPRWPRGRRPRHPYPPENAELAGAHRRHGGVVAEAPLGTTPQARHFPRRNRIIAGLSLGCVVVEAAPHSGSLITAALALDYGRELFAVPGSPLDPRSRGSNDLLRQGAHLTEKADDVLRLTLARAAARGAGAAPGFAEARCRLGLGRAGGLAAAAAACARRCCGCWARAHAG